MAEKRTIEFAAPKVENRIPSAILSNHFFSLVADNGNSHGAQRPFSARARLREIAIPNNSYKTTHI